MATLKAQNTAADSSDGDSASTVDGDAEDDDDSDLLFGGRFSTFFG